MRSEWFAILGLLVVPSGVVLGDLDVAIPPGTPMEWRFELPFHIPEGHRGPIYTHSPSGRETPKKEEKPVPKGRTVVVKPIDQPKPPPAVSRFGSFNPMGAARILTMDILGHMPWTQWKRTDSAPTEEGYPPSTRSDLYWLTLTALLRPMLHPAKVSRAETAHYLILIGPAVHDALKNGQNLGAVDEVVKYAEASIPRLPVEPPVPGPLVGKITDPEVKMLVRWASRELVSDHPYAYNPSYARRTLSLGAEALPVLMACSNSEHPLLCENATGLLASFDTYDEEVLQQLRKIFRGKDPVARNRALEGLIHWGDSQTQDLLIKAVKGGDRYLSAYAVQALGRLSSAKARSLIQEILTKNPGDRGDTWMTAVVALSRIADADGKTRKLLKKVAMVWQTQPGYLEMGPGAGADIPDRPGDRADLLVEAAMIALARLGDEAGQRDLLRRLPGLGKDAGGEREKQGRGLNPPGAPQPAPGRQAFVDPVLGNLQAFNQLLAIEALAHMGEDGRKHLKDVANRSTDFILRGYALDHLMRLGQDGEFVLKLAKDTLLPSVLRVQAMEGLARVEQSRDSALEVAGSMVSDYLGKGGAGQMKVDPLRQVDLAESQNVPSYECLAALKLLGRYRPPDVDTLVKVLERAKARGDYEHMEAERAKNLDPVPGGRPAGPGMVNQATLRAFPPLFETAVVELGRLADRSSAGELIKILKDTSGPGRVEAVLALGNIQSQAACDALLGALEDSEPWVRYAAYRSLKKLSGESHFADWLFGEAGERRKAVSAWKEWRRGKGTKLPV